MSTRARRWCLCVILLWTPATAVLGSPKIEHWQTRNGARVYFVKAPEIPIVDIRVIFDAGSARDGDKAGLAQLTSAVLREGAGGLNADQFAARMAETGARFGLGSLRDMAYVSLRSMTGKEYLQTALELLRTVLNAPNFDPDALQRQRARLLASIRRSDESPSRIADKAFYAAVYGDHPYASPPAGTVESVGVLTRADLQAFFRRYYVAKNAVVALVGDMSRRQARLIANRLIEQVPPGQRAAGLPSISLPIQPQQIVIQHKSIQSHVRLGQPGVSRHDPDYFALYVGNHVLGGNGLVSLLSQEVREKRGLSYSVYSYFRPMAGKGPFVSSLQTKNSQVDEARNVLKQTLVDFVENGPDEAKLEAAKRNIIGGFPLRISNNSKIIEYIGMIGFYDLPLDYLDTYTSKVQAVTAEQVKRAFQRHVDLAHLVTVTVGGAAEG